MVGSRSGQRHSLACAYGRKGSLHHLCPGGSQCCRQREILSPRSKQEGNASSDSTIALLNSNQMCGICNLFCSPFAGHKLSQALPNRKSRARGTSPPWHSTAVLQGNGDVVSCFIFVDRGKSRRPLCCPGSLQCLGEASPRSAALGLAWWLLVMSPQSPVIAESGVIFFVVNPLKLVLKRSYKQGPFVLSVILVLSCLVFILKRIFESFFWFSCCLWERWGRFLFLLKM